MNIAQSLFWLAALALFYTYLGYPLVMALRARLGAREHLRAAIEPTVSILVVAHNEAARIRERIENLLALEPGGTQPEIVIASDASGDATAAIAREYAAAGVRVMAFDRHRGKAAVLNDVIPRLAGEFVVLMDVRQHIAPDAVRRLMENFADPVVGAVSGELVLTPRNEGSHGAEGVGFYWRYEKFIRLSESRVDSTVGATGALYAIRRRLFEPIPADTLLDDVLIPMQIARKGRRVLFEPRARASEPLAPSPQAEFGRKARTIAGNFQLLFRHGWLLDPVANRLWFQTVSHKFLRLLGPALLLLALAANAYLLEVPFYRVTMALQLAFYAAAGAAWLWPQAAARSAALAVPHAFCLLNWCTVAGFYRFVRGQQSVAWATAHPPSTEREVRQ
jgi:cellulose synthase/poly-beta-1,6-N-acetylglucosamine synthase-like glycosyltransferase